MEGEDSMNQALDRRMVADCQKKGESELSNGAGDIEEGRHAGERGDTEVKHRQLLVKAERGEEDEGEDQDLDGQERGFRISPICSFRLQSAGLLRLASGSFVRRLLLPRSYSARPRDPMSSHVHSLYPRQMTSSVQVEMNARGMTLLSVLRHSHHPLHSLPLSLSLSLGHNQRNESSTIHPRASQSRGRGHPANEGKQAKPRTQRPPPNAKKRETTKGPPLLHAHKRPPSHERQANDATPEKRDHYFSFFLGRSWEECPY